LRSNRHIPGPTACKEDAAVVGVVMREPSTKEERGRGKERGEEELREECVCKGAWRGDMRHLAIHASSLCVENAK